MLKPFLLLIALLGGCFVARAQTSLLTIRVLDSLTREPLTGATVQTTGTSPKGVVTDVLGGATLTNLTDGPQVVKVSIVGYNPYLLNVTLPLTPPDSVITIGLAPAEAALEEVTVSATRTNRRIEDLPIKVDVLGQEDMDEESAVVPGNVASILGDISIIHIQRTSLTTGNQGIRMQGLDTKYTQILRDGLPLYEGFSGNLGVLQIPPLDLKQVEIVKGSASTLYGGGAVGGLINLVSRRPSIDHPDLTVVVNRSSLRENNLNTYYANQWGKAGLTLFAGYTNQKAVDVNNDDLSDVPSIKQFTVRPRGFFTLGEKDKLNVGYAFVTEKRAGGDVRAIYNPEPGRTYQVTNDLYRHTVDATYDHEFKKGHTATGRGTVSYFDRTQVNNGFAFSGQQTSGYFEAVDYVQRGKHTAVFGANLTLEQFKKSAADTSRLTDFTYRTTGIFVQDDYVVSPKITFQGGLRLDVHNVYGNFFLPRLSILTKPGEHWTIRTSIGTGYKTPNVFANLIGNDSVTNGLLSYRYLQPLEPGLKSERSLSLNMDVAYEGHLGEHLTVQLDQAFYYTFIRNPVVAISDFGNRSQPLTRLRNAAYNLRSIGTDTYLRLTYDELELYLGYNHTLAKRDGSSDQTYVPFSPQDKFSFTTAYSFPDKWRFGIEASWVGNQYLYNNRRVPNYWFWAAAVERMLGRVSIILNAENIFNVQQLRFGSPARQVVTGPITNPTALPLWAPQEGTIVNLALKYKLH